MFSPSAHQPPKKLPVLAVAIIINAKNNPTPMVMAKRNVDDSILTRLSWAICNPDVYLT